MKKKIDEIVRYLFRVNDIILVSLILVLINTIVLSLSNYYGCDRPNLLNILRMDLFCNGCISILYNIQDYIINLYMFIGIYLIRKANEIVNKVIEGINSDP